MLKLLMERVDCLDALTLYRELLLLCAGMSNKREISVKYFTVNILILMKFYAQKGHKK